jgi:EAL and modified HD-GYP domain-containing signal transduction protein
MNDHPILGQVALGYSPMIDPKRAVIATRLTVFPLRPDATPNAAALLEALAEVWPAAGGRVSLNVASETLLRDLMAAAPSTNLMIEVPAFMASDPAHTAALLALHASGNTLLVKGRPTTELPREVLPCFTHSIVDLGEERRVDATAAPGIARTITHVQAGVRTLAEMEASFKRGAVAVLGWPIDDAILQATGKAGAQPDLQTMLELIRRVDQQEPIERLEATMKRDPTLAFKLMRYINSPAFGLSVEISSFRHAIMMLGYQRLKRWLALLLVSASKDQDMKPVMFAAVRRGLLMEELVRGIGDDQMRNEAFICGVFSLLDRMMKQPFAELLKTIPVPEGVYQALVDGTGPFQPYFEVVRAVEQESLFDMREAAERLMTSIEDINRAELRALSAAAQLD